MRSKLAVILIADITGYTAYLSSAGPSEIRALIHQQKALLSPLIEAHGGRIIKWMGDAVMADFVSAGGAIHCGRAMHDVMARATERGQGVLTPSLKVVVHAGDVEVDADGDLYGDAVNLVARIEKLATTPDVYFSQSVRLLLRSSEVPSELVGEFDFKGIAGLIPIYRTCFDASPVMLQDLVLAHTNFTGIYRYADELGWEGLHPLLDELTARIIEISRSFGGTNRGVMHDGCFLTFSTVEQAINAAASWQNGVEHSLERSGLADLPLQIRTALHFGPLSILRYSMMGRDIEIVKLLSVLGNGKDVLLTAAARDLLTDPQIAGMCSPRSHDELRVCGSRQKWIARYPEIAIFAYPRQPGL